MRLVTGKRIGQSRPELRRAVLFSFIIHALTIVATLILFKTSPKFYVPPAYHVDLVGSVEPTEIVSEQAPALPPPPEPAPKVEAKSKPSPPKPEAMPELKGREPAAPARSARQAVAVAAPQEFRSPSYVALVLDKIKRNWNPTPGAVELKAKVIFTIHRSGRVIKLDLAESSGNFYFDQAAMRAVSASSPLPPFPDGVFSMSEEFIADLMPEE
jgi:TonB family protein